jgi:hypothetical protein
MDARGDNIVISYTLDFSATDEDVLAVHSDIFGRSPFTKVIVSQSSIADEARSSVAISKDGHFDVAYQFKLEGANEEDIILTRFDSAGGRIDDKVIANSTARETNPSVAMDTEGDAVVAYQKFVGSDFDIKAKRVSSLGAMGGEIPISNTPSQELHPTVALSRTGGAFVVAYDTDLIGVPGNRTVEVAEVTAADGVGFRSNLPAFPNDAAPALSMGIDGKYMLSYTAAIGAKQHVAARAGQLFSAVPEAKNLVLSGSIHAGQSATLSGRLVDADGDRNLTLMLNWGDGSLLQQTRPGIHPFVLKHRYAHAGIYTVHATWTDSTGLSNSRALTLTVKKAK